MNKALWFSQLVLPATHWFSSMSRSTTMWWPMWQASWTGDSDLLFSAVTISGLRSRMSDTISTFPFLEARCSRVGFPFPILLSSTCSSSSTKFLNATVLFSTIACVTIQSVTAIIYFHSKLAISLIDDQTSIVVYLWTLNAFLDVNFHECSTCVKVKLLNSFHIRKECLFLFLPTIILIFDSYLKNICDEILRNN